MESDWVADRYAFNPLAAHKIKLTVGEDGYIVWVDGERQIVYPLPENYKGGYVGIGTGYTSTEIRNLRINLKKKSQIVVHTLQIAKMRDLRCLFQVFMKRGRMYISEFLMVQEVLFLIYQLCFLRIKWKLLN